MRYLVVLEQGPTSFGAYVPDLPGCVAAGDTRDEAMTLIREAIELPWIDCMTDLHGPKAPSGLRLPAGESIEIVLNGSATMVKSYPEIFAELLRLVRYANNLYAEALEDVRITVIEA